MEQGCACAQGFKQGGRRDVMGLWMHAVSSDWSARATMADAWVKGGQRFCLSRRLYLKSQVKNLTLLSEK
jgi:hypothetical protein